MHTLNQQTIEKVTHQADGALELSGPPWLTIQGEGPFAGRPAVFVRLAGCTLQCMDCDSDYTSDRNWRHPNQLVKDCLALVPDFALRSTAPNAYKPLLVLTGGEPFRQSIGKFCHAANAAGFHVQIETNGTLYRDDLPWYGDLTIVCSPKTPSVADDLKPYIHHLKYVTEAGKVDNDGLPLTTISYQRPCRPWHGFRGTVYVQPADLGDPALNAENTRAAVESCLKFGYVLSFQLHKVIGVK
jgi:7-carboxy-7-deazaguanine synthase